MGKMKFRDLEYKILAMAIFLAPFDTLRLPGIYITISDIFLISLLPFVIIDYLQSKIVLNGIFKKLLVVCVFIIVGYILSLLRGGVDALSSTITYMIQFAFVLIYIPLLLNKYLYQKDSYLKLLSIYISGFIVAIIIGLVLENLFPVVYNVLIIKNVIISSVRFGAFIGSNGLAKAIATFIPLVFLLYHKGLISKKHLLGYLMILFIGLLKTSSNGGTVATIISLILVILLTKTWELKKEIYLIVGAGAIIGFILISTGAFDIQLFIDRVYNNLRYSKIDDAGSYGIKIVLMLEAIIMIFSNPIIGIGADQYASVSKYSNTVHNSYLSFWVEGGILSFLGLLGMLVLVFKLILNKVNLKGDRNLSIFTGIYTVVLMINFITDTQIYQRFRMIPLVLVIYILYQNTKYRLFVFNRIK